MTTLPNIGLVLPTRGAPGSGLWSDALDAMMALIDSHSHQTGSGVLIRPAAIGINADLTFAGFSATNLRSLAFAAGASVTGVRKIYVGVDGELYWNTNGGAAVKLTNGTALNVAAFVGGIGGDYSSIAALLDYDDATDSYRFRQQTSVSVRQYAKLRAGDLLLFEYKAAGDPTVPTNAVTVKSPAALASSYTMTMPAAVPGSTALVQMSSAGVLTASNTVTNLITASAGVTCATDQHVTVSGTGDFKHGDRTWSTPGAAGQFEANATRLASSPPDGSVSTSGATTIIWAIPLRVGDRIKSLVFSRKGDGAADITAAAVVKLNSSTGATSTLGSTTVTNPGATLADTTIDVTDTTLAANESVIFYITANAANITIDDVRWVADRP